MLHPKWTIQHQRSRKALPLPAQPDLKKSVRAHSPKAASLPAQEQDLIGRPIFKALAGDTISVASIGCIFWVTLANTTPGVRGIVKEQHIGATWVGAASQRGFDRSKDNLHELVAGRKRKWQKADS